MFTQQKSKCFFLASRFALFLGIMVGTTVMMAADIDDKPTALPNRFNGSVRAPDRMIPAVPLAGVDITARVPSREMPNRMPPDPKRFPGGHKELPTSEVETKIIDLAKLPIPETWQISPVFFWPDTEKFRDAENRDAVLRVVEEGWDTDFAKWMSLFVSFREPQPAKLKLYKTANQMVSYCLPGEENTIVRFVHNPQNKVLTRPAQIQFMIQVTHSNESIRELMATLAKRCGEKPIAENDLSLLADAIKAVPLSQNLKNIHWQLENFGYDCTYDVAKINMIAKDKDFARGLSLQVAIGPCGDLLVLSGIGLEPVLKYDPPKTEGGGMGSMESAPQK